MSGLRGGEVDLMGFAAAFCTTTAFVPQLLWVIKLRSAREISLETFLLFSIGVGLWLVYGNLCGVEAGDCVECCDADAVGKHSSAEAAALTAVG